MFLRQIASIFYGLVDVVGNFFNFLNMSFESIIENYLGISINLGSFGDFTPLYLFFNVGIVFVIAIWIVRLFLGIFTD